VNLPSKEKKAKAGKLPKNAARTHRRVHLRMMAGDHFPRKNVLLSKEDVTNTCRFLKKRAHF
jgi:hypothetical protein